MRMEWAAQKTEDVAGVGWQLEKIEVTSGREGAGSDHGERIRVW